MSPIIQTLPTERVYKNRGKIAGLFAGILGTLAMGAFASVVATGHPIDMGAPPPVQVYSNF
ncbi:MAG: hypothetical protein AAFY06_13985 [Pseudomonadota bacterium]